MRSRRFTVLAFSVVLIALAAAAGVASAFSRPDVTSTNTDAVRTTTINKNINVAANTPTTIVSVTLPAGAWVITADATTASPAGEGNILRCGVYRGTTRLDVSSRNTSPFVGALSATAALKTTSAFVASLKCSQDDAVSGSPNYVDAGATLWAHKAASLAP
jgi:hypothetical protein